MALVAAMPATAVAQAPAVSASKSCTRALPAPDCRSFSILNAGGFLSSSHGGGATLLLVVDLGRMVNVSPRNAIGGSWFASLDEFILNTGPVARYRRWLALGRSIDFAVGTPVPVGAGRAAMKPGSILGLVKYNPEEWFGVALRPDYLRRPASYCCLPPTFVRVSVGVELAF